MRKNSKKKKDCLAGIPHKKEVVKSVAKASGVTIKDTDKVISNYWGEIASQMKKGESVNIPCVGTFAPKKISGRKYSLKFDDEGKLVKKGSKKAAKTKSVTTKAHTSVRFYESGVLSDYVAGNRSSIKRKKSSSTPKKKSTTKKKSNKNKK